MTGDDIISEILRNCDAGQFKIRYTTVLPSVYHVYLHPSDYDLIRPVIAALTAEARSALIDKMDELSRAGKPSAFVSQLGFGPEKQMEYKILDPDWIIEFHPDAEEKLQREEIEIFSELASSQPPEFEGAVTRHVTKRLTTTQATTKVTPPSNAYGQIRYQNGSEPQTFAITKDTVVIGRGGKSFWVDLKVEAPPDVSREHCRIRRDPASGRFFIQDVSQYGTSIDGKPIGGKNVDTLLPGRCTITLADVVTLEFEAA